MTLLRHESLVAAVREPELKRRLVVMPLLEERIGPATIDLRLGTEFIEVVRREEKILDPLNAPPDESIHETRISVPIGESLVLHPGHFILGATLEFIRMPAHLGGQLLGRSSWARLGLIVATAVVVQPGFAGSLTLELVNMGDVPITLYPGLRVAQLAVWDMDGETQAPYIAPEAKYRAPLGPESSRLGWEADELERLVMVGRLLKGQSPP